ncbi:hypothetical protein AVEN_4216-1 [Araneus ventricosus]|uniref:Uncharacterized protein n=1 Tax=Araneus ventricosus TaxID=182803 RepID=A0A4Y2FBD3_ARAVE|nr:hypothetical protein AVEN_4216-1 [Araneus ventricosus]
MHNFTLDTKSTSMTWKHPNSPVTKKIQSVALRREDCADSVLGRKGCHFDLFLHFRDHCSRICDTLTKLMSAIRRKRPGFLSRGVLFLDDNALGTDFYQDGFLILISHGTTNI